jgi:hypothetical protein
VHREATAVCDFTYGGKVFFIQDGAAAAVVSVLEADKARTREVVVLAADCGGKGGQAETPPFVIRNGPEAEAADGPSTAYFED